RRRHRLTEQLPRAIERRRRGVNQALQGHDRQYHPPPTPPTTTKPTFGYWSSEATVRPSNAMKLQFGPGSGSYIVRQHV
ncbi:hypothetical protein, partial [Mycolicibacterium goodii]|uniref:hypothetical protein n=1 Tax=Mycolicibacterium goodii TaxID=134601 RepID=UPI001BDD23F5